MFVQPTAALSTHFLERLNARQREAATAACTRPLLILAGAGTGKTTTLTSRVAWLIEQGTRPERILVLTFTRRAARSMLQQVRGLMAQASPDGPRVVGGTFHSVAYRLARRHAVQLGLGDGISVIDTSDLADLIDLVRDELGLATTGRRVPRKTTLADVYSRTVNLQQPLSHVLAAHYPWCADDADTIAAVCREVTARKRQAGLLDYDDLLLLWQAAMRHPQLSATVAGSFDHVLVDEYQDVNALQVEIVAAFAAAGTGISVVGDDMQAIYGFRAASREHILDFPRRFAGAEVVRLEDNYRSTQPILDLGNQVAAEAEHSFRRRLTAAGRFDHPVPARLVVARDENGEAEQVAVSVLEHYERGVPLREQAVLMRAAHHSNLLELELGRRNVPFVKYGGIRHLEAAHVKDFVAAVRVALNHGDSVSWFRLLQLFEGVGPAAARRGVEALTARARPIEARLARVAEALPEPARDAWPAFQALFAESLTAAAAGAQAELLRRALDPLLERRYADAAARRHDLEQLVHVAAAHTDLEAFVSDLVLDPPQTSSDFAGRPQLDEDYLVLSTIHSAKGLEWTVVHVLHASDGNIPSDMALAAPDGLEEERRLFYVAVTRPRRHLHLYAPLRYYHRPRASDDAHGYAKLSRFLSETVQDLLERHDPIDAAEAHARSPPDDVRPPAISVDHLWA
jgi:DNA helicase-2/ATP-dependent DNA helicase PcrA